MERASKSLKKVPAKKQKKKPETGKIPQKSKAAPSRKGFFGKSHQAQKESLSTSTGAESQQGYFEDLGSRLAKRAYELYVQRGQEHGHDIEDWLEAERQILPKEISERA